MGAIPSKVDNRGLLWDDDSLPYFEYSLEEPTFRRENSVDDTFGDQAQ